jgi:hypothetical protein
MTEARTAPTNLDSLTRRLENAADGRDLPRRPIQRAVANTIVGQMLPPGVVLGGSALMLRLGPGASRFSPGFDLMRPADVEADAFIAELGSRVDEGWSVFSGSLQVFPPAELPEGSVDYPMQSLRIRLSYKGRHWLTVPVRLGHDEIGSAAAPQPRLSRELARLFVSLGLEAPQPVPLLATAHEVARKLQAVTALNPRTGRNARARDLVDLQLLEREQPIDMAEVDRIADRLFAARNDRSWPPTVVAHEGWQHAYADAAEGLEVIAELADAIEWANTLIARTVLIPGY